MTDKNAANELKIMMISYLLFWEEWIRDENCRISRESIRDITFYLKNNFKTTQHKHFAFYTYKSAYMTDMQNIKLKSVYPIFKEWVIFKFLCTLISAAKIHGVENFLERPVMKLNVPEKIKNNLKAFKIKTIHDLPQTYTADSLGESPAYENILHFLVLNKTYKIDRKNNSLSN